MVRANVRSPLRAWAKGRMSARRGASKRRRAQFRRKKRGINKRAVTAIVNRQLNRRTETKFISFQSDSPITSDVVNIINLTGCSQGDGPADRDGSTVFCKSIQMGLRMDLDVANHSRDIIRYLVVLFPKGDVPTGYSDVLFDSVYPDYYTTLYTPRNYGTTAGYNVPYKVLVDDLEELDTAKGKTTVFKKIRLKINKKLSWDEASTTSANQNLNRIYLFVMAQHANASNPSTLHIESRMYFKDS